MNENKLDRLLAEIGGEPLPDHPKNMEDRVRRTIRELAVTKQSRPLLWSGWLTNPGFALGLIVASMGVGLLLGPVFEAPGQGTRAKVREALALDVFTVDSMGDLFHRPIAEES